MVTLWWVIDTTEPPAVLTEAAAKVARAEAICQEAGVKVREQGYDYKYRDFAAACGVGTAVLLLGKLKAADALPAAADCETEEELATIEPLLPSAQIG